VEAAAGHGVEAVLDGSQVFGAVAGQVGPLADVAAQVAVLIGRALPGRVRVTEVDVEATQLDELLVAGHLASLIPDEGAPEGLWDAS
jgi:hypothetical protein